MHETHFWNKDILWLRQVGSNTSGEQLSTIYQKEVFHSYLKKKDNKYINNIKKIKLKNDNCCKKQTGKNDKNVIKILK